MSNMENTILPTSWTCLVLGLVFQGLETYFRSVSTRAGAISDACDEGVNLDLLRETDISRELATARSPGDFPLVCVKGVVKTYEHFAVR